MLRKMISRLLVVAVTAAGAAGLLPADGVGAAPPANWLPGPFNTTYGEGECGRLRPHALNDGRLLIVCENRYHFPNKTWILSADGTTLAPGPEMDNRTGYGIARLPDGRLLFIGGLKIGGPLPNESLNSVIAFDPSTDTFSSLASMQVARSAAVARVIAGDRVLVYGGNSTVEIYDPATDSWSFASPPDAPLSGPAVVLNDGRVYVPQSRGLYDPITDDWSLAARFPVAMLPPRFAHVVPDGRVVLHSDQLWLYDPATNTYSNGPLVWTPSPGMSIKSPGGGIIFVGSYLVVLFDPVDNKWRTLPSVPSGHSFSSLGLLDNTRIVGTGIAGWSWNGPVETYLLDVDSDGDGYIDTVEVALSKNIADYCEIMRADFDGNGTVNSADLALTAAQFGPVYYDDNGRGDQDGNFTINAADLGLVAARFGGKVANCP